ncbi:hypothetical protein [Bradyrhizobium canariense]|uniref:Uncharacterized protein n=1 Tax=Bradyrhizobium canariense TaxID=255045 RepID=A0A1H1QVX9_9BRAD|nr:hypothetical protein [Bradyrhizobium canariense]SDS27039.1 hypothetical protein SAMN05444158_1539 [Bradyrhizobium canariense]
MFPIHHKFPKEMAVVGRILVDYGEIELDLLNCVQMARGRDMNSTLKTMFRVRGELSRIQIADALGRVPYTTLGLGDEFEIMIDAFDYCRRIRNKYAHAYWHDPVQGKRLCYVSLEELADEDQPVNDLGKLTFFFIDEPLLLQQETYFEFVRALLSYLNWEGQVRSKLIKAHVERMPVPPKKPPFFTAKWNPADGLIPS